MHDSNLYTHTKKTFPNILFDKYFFVLALIKICPICCCKAGEMDVKKRRIEQKSINAGHTCLHICI